MGVGGWLCGGMSAEKQRALHVSSAGGTGWAADAAVLLLHSPQFLATCVCVQFPTELTHLLCCSIPPQFLAKKQSMVRQADLAGLGVGQKDMTKGAFQVWTELLQKKVGDSAVGRVFHKEWLLLEGDTRRLPGLDTAAAAEGEGVRCCWPPPVCFFGVGQKDMTEAGSQARTELLQVDCAVGLVLAHPCSAWQGWTMPEHRLFANADGGMPLGTFCCCCHAPPHASQLPRWLSSWTSHPSAVACKQALTSQSGSLCLPQKAPGIIGRAAETDVQRAVRLYGMLHDFGEADLVLG